MLSSFLSFKVSSSILWTTSSLARDGQSFPKRSNVKDCKSNGKINFQSFVNHLPKEKKTRFEISCLLTIVDLSSVSFILCPVWLLPSRLIRLTPRGISFHFFNHMSITKRKCLQTCLEGISIFWIRIGLKRDDRFVKEKDNRFLMLIRLIAVTKRSWKRMTSRRLQQISLY